MKKPLKTFEPNAPKPGPLVMGVGTTCPHPFVLDGEDAPAGFEPWKAHGLSETEYWRMQYLLQADVIGLIPMESLRAVSVLLDAGRAKHGAYDPLSETARMAKILRHAGKWLDGQTDEDHAVAVAANALLLLEARRRRLEVGG